MLIVDQHYDPDFNGIVAMYLANPYATPTAPLLLPSPRRSTMLTSSPRPKEPSANLRAMILWGSTTIAYSDRLPVTNGSQVTDTLLHYGHQALLDYGLDALFYTSAGMGGAAAYYNHQATQVEAGSISIHLSKH